MNCRYEAQLDSAYDRLEKAHEQIKTLEQVRDHAYRERNQLVAALSHFFPAGVKETKIEGWDPDWHGCVYIDLPSGQVSWHFHKREADLFAHLPPYKWEWDGHGNEEKYERLQLWAKKEGIYD